MTLDKQTLGRGAAYIYIQVFVTAISGYVFWLIMSHLTSSMVIGTLSAIISITEILTSFAAVGIPDSIQRFLGKTFSEGKTENSKVYVTAALFIISIGFIASILFILIGGSFLKLIEINSTLQLVLIFIIGSNAVRTLLNSILISSLKTRTLPLINIMSSTTKIALSIVVVLLGSGAIGLAITYLLVDNILSSIMLGVIIISMLKSVTKKEFETKISFTHATKNILIGGLATWLPILVTTFGYQLGTIVLFGSKGSSDTAVYFLTLNIVNGILLTSNSLFAIALPALSSMQDGRKKLAWQTIRWSSLISMPLSSALVFYSQDVIQLFGKSYVAGELVLQILLLSVLPTIVAAGIGNLVYAYGNYKQSLAIDFAMNIPRTVLYFLLIPVYGMFGGATSFVIGSLLALIVSIVIVSKIRMFIFWNELIMVSIIPLAIGYLMNALQINYAVGILITVVLSYLILLKLNVITRSDIHDLLSILPSSISNQILRIWKKKD
jgi:O-antigen/teichoic acid export membrane protein